MYQRADRQKSKGEKQLVSYIALSITKQVRMNELKILKVLHLHQDLVLYSQIIRKSSRDTSTSKYALIRYSQDSPQDMIHGCLGNPRLPNVTDCQAESQAEGLMFIALSHSIPETHFDAYTGGPDDFPTRGGVWTNHSVPLAGRPLAARCNFFLFRDDSAGLRLRKD